MKANGLMAFVGDWVSALVLPTRPHGGAYGEEIVAPAALAVHAPKNVDFPAASTLVVTDERDRAVAHGLVRLALLDAAAQQGSGAPAHPGEAWS